MKPAESRRSPGPNHSSSAAAASCGPRVQRWTSVHDQYTTKDLLGQGTYGIVYKAENKVTGEIVAMKRCRLDAYRQFGVSETALREMTLLHDLKHENIMTLHRISCNTERIYFVCEFLELDLRKYLRANPQGIPIRKVKEITFEIFKGLAFCHGHRVVHRDLKPNNVLVSADATRVKIADFGLARSILAPGKTLTHEVVTLWYRAPELLLGHCNYASGVDIWSGACMVAELLSSQPLFAGDSEIDTLFRIFRLLGTPKRKQWPARAVVPWDKFPKFAGKAAPFKNLSSDIDDLGCSFFDRLFQLDPSNRPSALEVLNHPWLSEVREKHPECNQLVPEWKEWSKDIDRFTTSQPQQSLGLYMSQTIGNNIVEEEEEDYCEEEQEEGGGGNEGERIWPTSKIIPFDNNKNNNIENCHLFEATSDNNKNSIASNQDPLKRIRYKDGKVQEKMIVIEEATENRNLLDEQENREQIFKGSDLRKESEYRKYGEIQHKKGIVIDENNNNNNNFNNNNYNNINSRESSKPCSVIYGSQVFKIRDDSNKHYNNNNRYGITQNNNTVCESNDERPQNPKHTFRMSLNSNSTLILDNTNNAPPPPPPPIYNQAKGITQLTKYKDSPEKASQPIAASSIENNFSEKTKKYHLLDRPGIPAINKFSKVVGGGLNCRGQENSRGSAGLELLSRFKRSSFGGLIDRRWRKDNEKAHQRGADRGSETERQQKQQQVPLEPTARPLQSTNRNVKLQTCRQQKKDLISSRVVVPWSKRTGTKHGSQPTGAADATGPAPPRPEYHAGEQSLLLSSTNNSNLIGPSSQASSRRKSESVCTQCRGPEKKKYAPADMDQFQAAEIRNRRASLSNKRRSSFIEFCTGEGNTTTQDECEPAAGTSRYQDLHYHYCPQGGVSRPMRNNYSRYYQAKPFASRNNNNTGCDYATRSHGKPRRGVREVYASSSTRGDPNTSGGGGNSVSSAGGGGRIREAAFGPELLQRPPYTFSGCESSNIVYGGGSLTSSAMSRHSHAVDTTLCGGIDIDSSAINNKIYLEGSQNAECIRRNSAAAFRSSYEQGRSLSNETSCRDALANLNIKLGNTKNNASIRSRSYDYGTSHLVRPTLIGSEKKLSPVSQLSRKIPSEGLESVLLHRQQTGINNPTHIAGIGEVPASWLRAPARRNVMENEIPLKGTSNQAQQRPFNSYRGWCKAGGLYNNNDSVDFDGNLYKRGAQNLIEKQYRRYTIERI